MSAGDTFFLLAGFTGGLALFLFALELFADEMHEVVGSYFRKQAIRTRSRTAGRFILGMMGGILMQSRISGLLLLSFLNARLVALEGSGALWCGLAVGSAVGVVVLACNLGAYFFIAIAVGFAMRMAAAGRMRRIGGGLMAAGLLFLGIDTMARSLGMQAETVSRLFGALTSGWPGRAGILAAAFLLAAGSGSAVPPLAVVIGAGHAGVLGTGAVLPAVIGAGLGAGCPVLSQARDADVETRRAVMVPVILALISSAAAAGGGRWVIAAAAEAGRAAAWLYLGSVTAGALLILVLGGRIAFLLRRLIAPRAEAPEGSHLDYQLINRAEEALKSVLRELHRVAVMCRQSMHLAGEIMLKEDARKVRRVRLNEEAVDEIKNAMRDYIIQISLRQLSRRQAVLVQHLNRCMVDLERIGDHVAHISEISLIRFRKPESIVDEETFAILYRVYVAARDVVDRVVESLGPELKDHQEAARRILEARDAYMKRSARAKREFTERLVSGRFPPCAGIYLSAYLSAFDRLVKHAKVIALAEQQPQFWIKESKLARVSEPLPMVKVRELVQAEDYLRRLQLEEYL